MSNPPFLAALLLLLLSSTPFPAASGSSSVCNPEKFIKYGIFADNLAHLFNDLVELGSVKPGENFYHNIIDEDLGFPAFGRSSCSGSLTPGDCSSCLSWAVDAVISWCYLAIGGQVELGECGLRYEQYDFV